MENSKNAIRASAIRGIILFVTPISILLSVFSMFSWYFLREQALENYSSFLQVTATQADDNLYRLQNWIANLFYRSDDFRLMSLSQNEVDRYIAAERVNQEVRTYFNNYENGLVYFIWLDENLHIPAVNTLDPAVSRTGVSDFIRNIKNTSNDYPAGKYFLTQLEDHWFLALYLHQRNVYSGVLVDVSDLLGVLDFGSMHISSCHFENESQAILASMGDTGPKDISLSASLTSTPISLTILLPESAVLGRFHALTTLSFILAFLGIVSLCAYIAYTRRQVSIPLQKLQETICKIEEGNTEQEIDIAGEKEEIAQVYQVFNGLIDNIVHLKLESYENKIARQQTELQYLRLQLRPHFFLNSLKRIYALAQEKQTDEIQQYLVCLANHYRFLIYDTTNTITLEDEIRHVQNYIQLQRIGYHIPIECSISMEANPTLLQVPPLVIQSFVENSIKYAVSPQKPLLISIQAKILSSAEGDSLNIICKDNGPGLPEDVIAEIENGSEEFSKKHVGFNNLKHRLALIYQRESFIYTYNQSNGGAVVDILIPVETPQKQKEGADVL